jgi:formate dehydrogenase major subunit
MEVLAEAVGESPLPKTNSRFGHPTPQRGVEVERKWQRPDYRMPGTPPAWLKGVPPKLPLAKPAATNGSPPNGVPPKLPAVIVAPVEAASAAPAAPEPAVRP